MFIFDTKTILPCRDNGGNENFIALKESTQKKR